VQVNCDNSVLVSGTDPQGQKLAAKSGSAETSGQTSTVKGKQHCARSKPGKFLAHTFLFKNLFLVLH
jgi:hypothetical protein